METITEIRPNPIFNNITAKNLFLRGETDFLSSSNHFFLHFSETLGSYSFFPSIVKVIFLTKSFIPASGKGFSSLKKPFSSVQSFSS